MSNRYLTVCDVCDATTRDAEDEGWRAVLISHGKAQINSGVWPYGGTLATGDELRRFDVCSSECPQCGGGPVQAHHHDYTKPRIVEWVCRPCHLEIHAIEATR